MKVETFSIKDGLTSEQLVSILNPKSYIRGKKNFRSFRVYVYYDEWSRDMRISLYDSNGDVIIAKITGVSPTHGKFTKEGGDQNE